MEPTRYTILLIYVFFIAGAVWNSLGLFQNVMSFTTPFVLIISGVAAFWMTYDFSRKTGIVFSLIFIGVWAIEALGVATGFPFGTYTYTDVLGWKILGVSLVIPFAWLFVIAASDAVVGHFFGRLSSVLVAVLATGFDFFLEFAADALGYWHWQTRFPPVSNYIAWFVISLIAVLVLRDYSNRRIELRVPAHLYFAQLCYFVLTVIGVKSGLLAL